MVHLCWVSGSASAPGKILQLSGALLLSAVAVATAACVPQHAPAAAGAGDAARRKHQPGLTRRSSAGIGARGSEARTTSAPRRAAEPSFLLAAAGDVNLGRDCGQRLLAEADYDPFRGIAGLWADADVRFVNLESGLSEQHGQTQSPRHGLVFTGPPGGADALLRARVDVVSTANNHAWDYARRGLFETLANLDRVGIAHAGTGHDEEEAYRPAIVHINGLEVAFFAVTQVWNLGVFSEEEARHHVAWADIGHLRAALMRARAESDFVVLSYHGGEEYVDAPVAKTRDFIDDVMSLGVDLVIGHHPHVPQGVGWYGSRPVFYSLGNLVFDGRTAMPWTRTSFLARLRFRRGAPVEAWACPYVIDGFEPEPLPVRDPAEQAFEQHLRAASATVGGTDLGERDALGCVPLSPASKSSPPTRDPLRADRGSVRLGLR